MADYADREENKFNNLGPQLGGMTIAIIESDAIAKERTLKRQLTILGMENITASASTTLIGSDNPIRVNYDVPVAIVADLRGLEVQTATIKTTMNVSASQEDNTSIVSNVEAAGSAKFGFGFFSGTASFKSSVGVNHDIRRKSDYSSTLEVNINMVQSSVPEGLMKILDSMNKVVETVTQVNVSRAVNTPALTAAQT